jgi:transcription elongation GreA/GreB family factor
VIPDNVAAPGTAVTYTLLETGETHTINLLGPWDTADNMVNYLAPAGQPLLGKKVGDTAELPSEFGERDVRIDSLERLF